MEDTTQYYGLSEIDDNSGDHLEESDWDKASDFVDSENVTANHDWTYSAENIRLKSLLRYDLFYTLNGTLVFSDRFVELSGKLGNLEMNFQKCTIIKDGKTLTKENFGRDFYLGKVTNFVDVIDKNTPPMYYWPHLKRFKSEKFVINKKIEGDFCLAQDMKMARMIICSQRFVSFCKKEKLKVHFWELPCCFDPSKRVR